MQVGRVFSLKTTLIFAGTIALVQLASAALDAKFGRAGVIAAAAAAGFLTQADVLPTLANPLWDSSWLLTDDGWLGRTLHALVGYTARPTGVQALVYLATIALLGGGARLAAPRRDSMSAVPSPTP